jgi:hypothetical protein
LNRTEATRPALTRSREEKASEWCSRFIEWADDDTRLRQLNAYGRLHACNVWDFQYSELNSAVARLDDLIQTGR